MGSQLAQPLGPLVAVRTCRTMRRPPRLLRRTVGTLVSLPFPTFFGCRCSDALTVCARHVWLGPEAKAALHHKPTDGHEVRPSVSPARGLPILV
jgi:hypothetical protein